MTVGDTIIAFGLLAIIVVLTCEACWRARVPRWQGPRVGLDAAAAPRQIRDALGGARNTHHVEGQQGK